MDIENQILDEIHPLQSGTPSSISGSVLNDELFAKKVQFVSEVHQSFDQEPVQAG
jgi:hypothetical protein